MKSKPLRDSMPETAKMIDAMRANFGTEVVNAMLLKSMQGEAGCFYAVENGHRFGTPDMQSRWSVRWDRGGASYSVEADWMFIARCIAISRGIQLPRMTRSRAGTVKELDATDRENHAIAAQAREIYLSATDEEMFSATTITRDDIK